MYKKPIGSEKDRLRGHFGHFVKNVLF